MTLRPAVLILAALAASHAFAQMSQPMVAETTTKVSDHVWAIMGFPNIAIVVGSRATLVVDTGLGPKNGATIARVVARLAPNNSKLFLTTTHFHPEHAAGEPGFPAGTILIRNAVQQQEMKAHGQEMIDRFSTFSAQNKELLAGVVLRPPDITFDQEAAVDLGGVTARLLWFGGAHTKGDELTFVEPDRTLISGDVVQNKVIPNIFGDGGTPASWLAVLDKVAALNAEHVLPDHSAPGDGSMVAAERTLISEIRTRALALKGQGTSVDDAGKQISSELKAEYPDWPNINAAGFVKSVYAEAPTQPSAARPPRPPAPTRDPNSPGYVKAKKLPDGVIPSPSQNGNFIVGPTHKAAPEMAVKEDVPHGHVFEFTMDSKDSKIYPGVVREPGTVAQPDPADPNKLIVNSHPAPYTRKVAVYVPHQYVPGTEAPFIVGTDGPDKSLFTALDNLIAEKRVPVMIAISIGNGGGDAQGSQRGLEYDTMSGVYAEFVETEVLPSVERQFNVKLTKDPNGRAVMGCSSGGAAAMAMAWYHPDLYHRVLSYSGTFVYQQWPYNAATPHGAWEFHDSLIPHSAKKPLRIWMQVSDRDNLSTGDNYHDWVLANERMAKVLAQKRYPYQFLFTENAVHCDHEVRVQTLPLALEYVWHGYSKH